PSADMTAKRGVTAAFELSWQELATEAQQLGCLLSLFAVAPIPWVLVEGCLPDFNTEELEELRDEVLVNLSLLNEVGEGVYQLHPLIREFFSGKLEASAWGEKFKQSFCQVMVAIAKEIPQASTRQEIKAFSLSIRHLEEAATVFQQWIADEDIFSVFQGLGRFYNSQGLYNQGEPWYQQCLEITCSRFGNTHPDIAESLNNLAKLYYFQGRYEEAEPLYLQALAIAERTLGTNHPNTVKIRENLARLQEAMGKKG
ncbi:MAG: tetratricopeptide repeat protein, partial [Microcystaceae cyanobacterium]